jgi:sulfatase maturation enzyme AslB (radical SAM superfamily)
VSGLSTRARKLTERALLKNARTVRTLMLKTGRERTARWPDILQIESTNLCNAKCVFCPRDEMHRRQGVMDMDLYRKVVD